MKQRIVIKKFIYFSIIIFCTGIICIILLKGRPEDRLSLDSITQVGADIMRDVDKLGQAAIRISLEEEMQIGAEIDRMIRYDFGQSSELKPLEVYVTKVGLGVAKGVKRNRMSYHFRVLPHKMVNAFAIPGGYIYITKGMLDFLKTESELANIIGHEMTHIDAGHAVNAIKYEYALKKTGLGDIMILARIGHEIYRRGYNEVEELEADIGGVRLAKIAKYHPYGAVSCFQRMIDKEQKKEKRKEKGKRPTTIVGEIGQVLDETLIEYFQTHPDMDKRIKHIEECGLLTVGEKTYVGIKNYEQKTPLGEKDHEEEWQYVYPDNI